MSLGVIFKGPEGIVLAADSRVTLSTITKVDKNKEEIHISTFDNATKLLKIDLQKYVGVVTYGIGALGQKEPRTAHSFIPEFEEEILSSGGKNRISVEGFSKRFSDFFMKQWQKLTPEKYIGPDMIFLIGGYDEKEPYGKVFEIHIPNQPKPKEVNKGIFGPIWGGQKEFGERLLNGFDPNIFNILKDKFSLSDKDLNELYKEIKSNLSIPIPYQFLPLQDCVDLSILLLRTTIELQSFYLGVRGVGGAIDIAIITRTDGFNYIQQKKIIGEEF